MPDARENAAIAAAITASNTTMNTPLRRTFPIDAATTVPMIFPAPMRDISRPRPAASTPYTSEA